MDELLDTAPCGFVSFGDDGRLLAVNATLRGWLGHPAGRLEGRHIDVLLPAAGRLFYQAHLFPFLKLHGRVEEFYLTLASAAGDEVPVLLNAVRRERDGKPVNDCVVVTLHQRRRFEHELLEAKKRAEAAAASEAQLRRDLEAADEALRRQQAELLQANALLEARVRERTREVRLLASRLTVAEAHERARLAQVLHDGLQQQLYAVMFALRDLRERLDVRPEALTRLDDGDALVREAIAAARATSADLSSPVLHGGLVESLRWLGGHLHKRYGLAVAVHAPDAFDVADEGVRVLLFTLVRELLFNVVKHAGASRAEVRLRRNARALTITVNDAGRGFDPAALDEAGTGLGLPGVRQRLELLGGSLDVRSRPGAGTRVCARLPLDALTLN